MVGTANDWVGPRPGPPIATPLQRIHYFLQSKSVNRGQSESRSVINLPNKALITLCAFVAVARSNKTAVILQTLKQTIIAREIFGCMPSFL